MNNLLPLLFTFFTAYVCIRFANPVAVRLGLVDTPNVRKKHTGAVPLVGGIGIFVSVLTASMLFLPQSQTLNLYLISTALIVFIGVLDDYYDLPVRPRIVSQVLAASIMIYGAGLYIENLGNLFGFGVIDLGIFGSILTVVAVIAAINAFNMVDGIDGLAGMLSIVAFSALAFMLSRVHNEWFLLPIMLIAATTAYLMFNLEWPSAKLKKVFMGDAGSMLIGLTVIWLLVIGSQGEEAAFKPVTALWIVGLPLMDMVAIMFRRIKKGQSPFKPDRDHLHHIFMRAGLTPRQALSIITGIATVISVVGLVLDMLGAAEWLSLMLFCVLFAAYCYAIQHIWRILTILRK